MKQRVILEPTFILHRRPYSNTSLIVELLTLNHGRVSALARSARGFKSRYKGTLELFFPLLVSWTGQNNLKYLGDIELSGMPYLLEGDLLSCGFYLNELLMRLLHHDDPCHNLFIFYQETLNQLINGHVEAVLRRFEKRLLEALGYGLPLQHEAKTNTPIEANQFYQYCPDQGFFLCECSKGKDIFHGKSLLALHGENFSDSKLLKDIKRLMRITFDRLLGKNTLKSRELLR